MTDREMYERLLREINAVRRKIDSADMPEIPTGVLPAALRGYIIRGAAGPTWAAYDANNDGYILVGDGTDVNSVAVSGDATLANTGALTVAQLDDGGDKFDVSLGGANRTLTLGASAALNQNLRTTDSPTFEDVYVTDGGQFGISGNELLTVNAAGTFAFSGISGVTVEDDDYIGIGAAAGRLIFDSTPTPDEIRLADGNLDLNGNDLIIDTDGDSYLHASADDTVQLIIGATHTFEFDSDGYLNIPNGGRVVTDAVYARDSDGLKLYEDGGKGIFIEDSTSNVGVATTNPYAFDTTSTKFHVNAGGTSGAVAEVARFQGSDDADGSGGTIRLGTGNDRGMYLEGGRIGTSQYGAIGTTTFNGTKALSIYLNGASDVGINETDPDYRLDVDGVIGVSDNGGDPSTVTGKATFYGKDVSGTVEAFAQDEAGNAAQLTPHNYAGPVQPLPNTLHWSQYHVNRYAGIEKWYDVERALLKLEELTGEQFIYAQPIERRVWTHKKLKPRWMRERITK